MVTGMDGIVFWGPLLIHTIMDGNFGSGDALMLSSWDVCVAICQKLVICRELKMAVYRSCRIVCRADIT